jgi:hypothetical protein
VVVPRGRLDILISISEDVLIIIEVKKTSEQIAETAKQAGYSDWLNAQPESVKKSILLVVDVSEEYIAKSGEDFKPLLWGDLCNQLRRLLIMPDFRKQQGLVIAALLVAFVGAVEQNLLNLVSPEAECGRSLLYALTADHIRRSLG